jgi:hypothetical protein
MMILQLLLKAEARYFAAETVIPSIIISIDLAFSTLLLMTRWCNQVIADRLERATCLTIVQKVFFNVCLMFYLELIKFSNFNQGYVEMCLPLRDGGGTLRVLGRG